MALSLLLFCIFGIFAFSPFTSARNIVINLNSCGNLIPGVSFRDIEFALREAISMASNAANVMANAASNPKSDEAKRVNLITELILACKAGSVSCNLAQKYFSNIAALTIVTQSRNAGTNPLYLYCNEADLKADIASGDTPVQPYIGDFCNKPTFQALYATPNLILFCPQAWKRASDTIFFNNLRTANLERKHIDELTYISAIMLHELAHANSPITLPVFKDGISQEGR